MPLRKYCPFPDIGARIPELSVCAHGLPIRLELQNGPGILQDVFRMLCTARRKIPSVLACFRIEVWDKMRAQFF